MGNRILKESIRRSPQIDKLSWFEEVVYYRLLTVADDFGRLDGRIVVLTHDLFPTKDSVTKAQVSRAVRNMISLGLLAEYQVDGAPYLRFPTWEKHQHLRRPKQKYPAPQNGGDVPPNGGQVADNPPQSDGNPPSTGGGPQPKCGPTRAGAESESEIELESEIPPSVVESETREAPATAAGLPEENPFADCGDDRPSFDTVEVYAANNLAALTPGNMEELVAFKGDLPEPLIRHAIDEAAANGKRTWNYVRSILRRYLDAGYKSVGDVLAAEEARRANKPSGSSHARNYQQHEYKPEDFGADFYYDPSKDYPEAKTS